MDMRQQRFHEIAEGLRDLATFEQYRSRIDNIDFNAISTEKFDKLHFSMRQALAEAAAGLADGEAAETRSFYFVMDGKLIHLRGEQVATDRKGMMATMLYLMVPSPMDVIQCFDIWEKDAKPGMTMGHECGLTVICSGDKQSHT